MGEIANDIIQGRCCSECGQYFIKAEEERTLDEKMMDKAGYHIGYEHGYPVLCNDCYEEEKAKKAGLQQALAQTC